MSSNLPATPERLFACFSRHNLTATSAPALPERIRRHLSAAREITHTHRSARMSFEPFSSLRPAFSECRDGQIGAVVRVAFHSTIEATPASSGDPFQIALRATCPRQEKLFPPIVRSEYCSNLPVTTGGGVRVLFAAQVTPIPVARDHPFHRALEPSLRQEGLLPLIVRFECCSILRPNCAQLLADPGRRPHRGGRSRAFHSTI
jgi:hypothetical protein